MSRPEQKPRTFRRLLALVVLVAIVAVAWWLWSGRAQDTTGGFRTGHGGVASGSLGRARQ